MKKSKFIKIVSLPLFILFACGDDEFTTTVSGKVVNFGSGEPIEGARVILQDGVGTSGYGINSETSSDRRSRTLTDANGEFTVSLTGEFEAFLSVGKEAYQAFIVANQGAAVGAKSYGFGGNYENQVLELKAEAGFNPIFESTVPVLPTDSLVIIFQGTRRDLPADQLRHGHNIGWNRTYVGQQTSRFITNVSLDEEVVLTTGDTYAEYQIAYTRNGQWESKIDSVYVKSFEIFTDTIYY